LNLKPQQVIQSIRRLRL